MDAILAAAGEALARDGLDGANVNDIAARAGTSIGSLYQYFPTKEALAAALVERHTRGALDTLERTLDEVTPLPLEEAVTRVVAAMVRVHAGPLDRALARELERLGRLDDLQVEVDGRAGAAVAAFLTRRQGELPLPAERLPLVALLAVRAIDHLAHAALVDHPDLAALDVVQDELVRLVLGWLRRG